jgi:hypothetical protein
VADALRSLPCVESDSVNVDYDKKEATFAIKAKNSCTVEELKKKVADTGRGKIVSIKSVA